MAERVTLDRDTYRAFKSMNKDKMTEVLNQIYMDGKEDGRKELLDETPFDSIDFDKMRMDIGAIKGIGEARLEQIMEIIKKYLESK